MSKLEEAPAWHVYIVRTRDGALYTGVTTDVARRTAEHRAGGRSARYLRGRGPLEVVYRRRQQGRQRRRQIASEDGSATGIRTPV